jgi:hypothetical protein
MSAMSALPAAEAGLVEALCTIEFGMTALDQAPAMSPDCLVAGILAHMRQFRL